MPLKAKRNKNPLPKGFVQFTRVYGKAKTQPYVISVDCIASYRPRNKVKGNRTTLVTKSGTYINITERFTDVHRLLTQAVR